MPYFDTTYTDGVIAVREKGLLKDKILRLCELSAEEAFRSLTESGFGGGAETASSVYDYENLIAAEDRATDDFIREYAPSTAEKVFLLSPRDFHNAKALIKATYLGVDASRMLAPSGLIEISEIETAIKSGKWATLKEKNAALVSACEKALLSLEENPSGAKIGEIFEQALQAYLAESVKRKPVLKKLLIAKADMANILIAFRCGDKELATDKYLPCGSLSAKDLDCLFEVESDKILRAFENSVYKAFVKLCLEAKEKGLPMTEAEKYADGYETEYFFKKKFDLRKNEPFLYYVYRRKTECSNVRIVFACLLAGLSEYDVKKRLRAF